MAQAKMKCEACGKVVKFPHSMVGKSAKCPGCKTTIRQLIDQSTPPPAVLPPQPVLPPQSPPTAPSPVPAEIVTTQLTPPDRNDIATVDRSYAAPVVDSRIGKFLQDGQPVKVVAKLLGRVDEICTESENPEYAAVQHLPGIMSPDAIVLTNKRVIIFRAKALGRMSMMDVHWMDVADIHIKEGMVGASVSVKGTNGHIEIIDHLPKRQARCIYRVGQEREEQMREYRRNRMMEEQRNAASNVVIHNAQPTTPAPVAPTVGSDLTSRLQQLRSMLDAGLIDQGEFDAKKAEILQQL